MFIFTGCKRKHWAKTYGDSAPDTTFSIQQTKDSGYIAAGSTSSSGEGQNDVWVLKLDKKGNIVWQRTYGGRNIDQANSIQQTKDNGYIVVGNTLSFGAGSADFWVLKLDERGDVLWQKTYGGPDNEHNPSIQQTKDSSYIVAGNSTFLGSSVDLWVLRLDKEGNILWQKIYGGPNNDFFRSIQQTKDNGYIVAGDTHSSGADSGLWVLKLDKEGDIVWKKIYNRSGSDYASAINQTTDGGYIVSGSTQPSVGSPSDFWVLKLDEHGNIVWQKTYGGPDIDIAYSIQQTKDSGYIVAGNTHSFGAGQIDFWVLKLDEEGNIRWQKTYGGFKSEFLESIQQTKDGGYIFTGFTSSFGAGGFDSWFLKVDANGNISEFCPFGQNTSIIPDETSVIAQDSSVAVNTPSLTVILTSVKPRDTGAVMKTQCID